MNASQIIAITIPTVILLCAIIASSWLYQRTLERRMSEIASEFKAEMAALAGEIKTDLATSDYHIGAEMVGFKRERQEVIAALHEDIRQVKQIVENIERQLDVISTRVIREEVR